MELTRHRVVLRGDRAYSLDEYAGECPVQILDLGLESSYGSHVLDIDLQDGWAGLAVVGYFDNGEDCADSLLNNGVMEVPPSASKNPGTHTITFTGSDSEGYRVSTKIPYRILPKGCTTGSTPPPEPDKWQQYIDQVDDKLDEYFAGGNPDDVWTQHEDGPGWAAPTGGGGAGQNGATFIPHVSPEGEISWTNDKNLPNPDPVNIKGPQGPEGPAGTTDYNALENKPSLNGVTMEGDKTAEDYGLATKEELPKQATDTEAGIAKFKPIAEQGNNVPASILPDGTVVVPPGGGSTSSWRKIAEIDVTEPVTSIVVSQDGEGKPFSVHDMLVFNTVNLTIDEETNGAISFKLNGGGDISMNITVKQKGGLYFESEWMGYRVFTAGTSGFNAYYNNSGDAARKIVRGTPEKITKFELKNTFGGNFTGGNLIVYGRE